MIMEGMEKNTSECSSEDVSHGLKSILKQTSTLNLESEDSSYDSDSELHCPTSEHYDVSRTLSDTLGQEFAEYVTSESASNPGFLSRLEFARKLGYTENQVKVALSKLGLSASQNELLGELIQLDCSSSKSSTSNLGREREQVAHRVSSEGQQAQPISLRHIVIDGSNVAMSHGNNKTFSCRGIQLAVDYFKMRGHKEITVFVPSYRKENPKVEESPITDQHILLELEKKGNLVFTPSRTVGNKRTVCYDDRYILKLALETDGIVVSNDNYRDLTKENLEFGKIVENRMVMYSFVNDRFMPPEDPLGRNGPNLDQLLSKTPLKFVPPCPYGRKCTYGAKCKYFHPTIKQSVSDCLRKQAALKSTQSLPMPSSQGNAGMGGNPRQIPISRTRSEVPLRHGVGLLGSPVHLHTPPQQQHSITNNSHKKLQRQLSINPVSDPRIPAPTFSMASSTSESNLSTSTPYLSPFPTQPGLSEVWSPPQSASSPPPGSAGSPFPEDSERNRMFYHLSAIFPTHQVLHVLSLYPQETEAQVICKHILRLFN